MATNPQYAWTIYAGQLFPQGYGYPLWRPDPDPGAAREVEIGDVGWMANGGFFQLFNSRTGDKEKQIHADLPDDFATFNPPNLIISGPIKSETAIPPLCSQTIETFDASGSAQATTGPLALASAGASFSFKCTDNQGALLMFSPAAYSTEIRSKRHIINYMREHFMRWVQFSDKFGLDLKEHELFFVCGMTKTARWAVTAFQGNYKKKQGQISADLGSAGGLNMSVSISNQSLPQTHRKVGPSRDAPANVPLVTGPDGESLAAAEEPNDQCLFIHYYQVKRRLRWLRIVKAAAGSHNLPSPGPDEAELAVLAEGEDDDEDEFTEPIKDTYNPVGHLLDYILEHSDASIGIASDLDLYALFKDQEFPTDVPAALALLKPTVEVDENEVGTVAAHIDFGTRTTLEEETENLQSGIDPSDQPAEDMLQGTSADAGDENGNTQGDTDDDNGNDKTLGKHNPGAQASLHDGSVTTLAYSPDGRYAASGSEDTTVIIWNVPQERMMHKFTPHRDTVSSLTFSHDNRLVASGSNDKHIILWTVATGQEFKHLELEASIHSVVFSPDGTKLVAGAYDGSLWVWNTETYEAPVTIRKHLAVVTFIVFSADGRLMATGGTESSCCVWETANLANMEPLSVLQGHKGMVCYAAFAPDGDRIVTASDDGSSRVWKCESGAPLVLLHEHGGPVWSVAFSPDGKRVASGSSDSTVKVCDSYSGGRQLSLEGHESMINMVKFSSDGKYIASAASDGTVRLWEAGNGSLVATYNEHSDNVTTVQFSPDSSMLASGSHDGTVLIRPIIAP